MQEGLKCLFFIIAIIGEFLNGYYSNEILLLWLYFISISTFIFSFFYFTILERYKNQSTLGER